MKITKTASGKKKIKMSQKEWQTIGKKAGWVKKEAFVRKKKSSLNFYTKKWIKRRVRNKYVIFIYNHI